MALFLLGFFIGGFFGIVLMAIFFIGKREDNIKEDMMSKILGKN
jgi:hypothetical protein